MDRTQLYLQYILTEHHQKALHDKLSIHPARRHDQEANHGKNNLIACMDQLQQPWQN